MNEYYIKKIYFELSNICNFRCDFCPITVSKRKKQFMEFGLFRKGIKEIHRVNITDTIGFHVLGEPLLYPRIYDAIECTKEMGLRAELTTNGSLLDESVVKNLIDLNIDKLSISLQTVCKRDHASRNSRLDFFDYYSRILHAIRQIYESGNEIEIEINLMNMITKRFFKIDKDIRIYSTGREYREMLIVLIHDLYSSLNEGLPHNKIRQRLRKTNVNLIKRIGINKQITIFIQPFVDWGNSFTSKKIYPAKFGLCSIAFRNTAVLSNGKLTICCADYDGKTSYGSIRNHSIISLLTSKKARTLRHGFSRMRLLHSYCQNCFGSTTRLKTLLKSLLSIYYSKGPLKNGFAKIDRINLAA